ncbi:hypothetical protein BU16DRAFT_564957 [Lophium mytilinum]|uniref:Uncharacterized protein n=1 Tax=Lophium mytilinum TaxID=390894 RepID=A0A6A6QKF2_9PEZI|nr:hypothetical protein BU16DRAFT_564957 [Lophium mytilinum]
MNTTVTLRCAIEELQFLQDYSGENVLLDRFGNPGNVVGFITLLGVLGSGYVRRILDLYFRDPQCFPIAWEKTLFSKTIGWPTSSEDDVLEVRQRLASRFSGKTLSTAKVLELFFLVIPHVFAGSFMFEIIWLNFYFVFGLAQVILWLTLESGTVAINWEPRFGQLLPVVSAGASLPILTRGLLCQKAPADRLGRFLPIPEIHGAATIKEDQDDIHAAATEKGGPNDPHENTLDTSESDSQENDQYSVFPTSCKTHRTYMKA